VTGDLITSDGHIRPIVWNGLIPSLFLISYVINIGYSRSWKKWPAMVSAGSFLAIGATSYMMDGNFESRLLAGAILGWELYIFSHLGVAFVIAALIATPGCEMRAFHDLYSLVTGRAVQEHYCPVGPLRPIDQWEAERRGDRAD
jgi:hypothetical protein